jgi:hypothetical protein
MSIPYLFSPDESAPPFFVQLIVTHAFFSLSKEEREKRLFYRSPSSRSRL